MLTDQTADVGAIRTRLAPKARRVCRVSDREVATVEDLPPMEVCERYFGRRHQIQIPVAADLEQIRLELRQVSGARQRGSVRQERRFDFGIAVCPGVQI